MCRRSALEAPLCCHHFNVDFPLSGVSLAKNPQSVAEQCYYLPFHRRARQSDPNSASVLHAEEVHYQTKNRFEHRVLLPLLSLFFSPQLLVLPEKPHVYFSLSSHRRPKWLYPTSFPLTRRTSFLCVCVLFLREDQTLILPMERMWEVEQAVEERKLRNAFFFFQMRSSISSFG